MRKKHKRQKKQTKGRERNIKGKRKKQTKRRERNINGKERNKQRG
jgi:hypothetical protein